MGAMWEGEMVCIPCYEKLDGAESEPLPLFKETKLYDATFPEHYHRYDMDTITFLKQGFPPEVYKGFCIGNVIKYTQRYELKNGQEDLDKAAFYQKELVEWVKATQ